MCRSMSVTRKTTEFEVRVRIPGWAVNDPMPGGLYTYADKLNEQTKILREWYAGEVFNG